MGSIEINSKEAFQKQIDKNKTMCLYHWNYCGHCQSYMPVWEKITRIYPGIKVELTTMKLLQPEYQVSAFPVVAIYEKGVRTKELVGARDEKNLLEFAKTNLGSIKSDKKPVKKSKANPAKPSEKKEKKLKK